MRRRRRSSGERKRRVKAPRYLTVAEAAAFAGMTEGAIRARIDRGTLPVERRGRRVLVPMVALYEHGLVELQPAATVAELLDRLERQAERIGELEARLRKYE